MVLIIYDNANCKRFAVNIVNLQVLTFPRA